MATKWPSQLDALNRIANKSRKSDGDHYSRVVAAVSDLTEDQEQRVNDEDANWPCRCGHGKQTEGEWTLCEDPECTLLWYHSRCLDGFEPSKITRRGKWICRQCFARRNQVGTMARIGANLIATHRWVDETHNQLARDLFTGLVPYPPQALNGKLGSPGDQVPPSFHVDPEWQRRIALQQSTRVWTNCRSRVSAQSRTGRLLFEYLLLRTPFQDTAEGLCIAFTCDPWAGDNSPVKLPLSLLSNRSPLVATLVQNLQLDFNEKWTLGPFRLPYIDRHTANQAINYLRGQTMAIGASNIQGSTISNRNLSVLVQFSSFAHLFDIPDLQQSVVHALWHFLVLHKQPIPSQQLRTLAKRTFPGYPARAILAFVNGQSQKGWRNSLRDIPGTVTRKEPGKELETIVSKVLEAAVSPYVIWHPALRKALSENRNLPRLWKQLSPLVRLDGELLELGREQPPGRE